MIIKMRNLLYSPKNSKLFSGLYGICNAWYTIYDNFSECDSQGRLIDTDKWDNHNTIARGWLTSGEDHYQPVTFRKIYNSKNQPMGVSPMPNQNISHADMEQMAQQAHHQQMMHPSNDNNTVPVDVPEEGCADQIQLRWSKQPRRRPHRSREERS